MEPAARSSPGAAVRPATGGVAAACRASIAGSVNLDRGDTCLGRLGSTASCALSDGWRWRSVERLARDLRIGARGLRRSPAFMALVVAVLGLGAAACLVLAARTLRGPPAHPLQPQ